MTREQFDSLYKGKAVWCKTEGLAIEFLALAHSVGYTWQSCMPLLTRTNWAKYLSETVYVVENTKEFFPASVSYGKRLFVKEIKIPIVEFVDQQQPEPEPQTPRVFDADALAIELSAIHKHLSLIDEPISGLIDVVRVEDLPKVKELREHYEKMSEIIESLKGE